MMEDHDLGMEKEKLRFRNLNLNFSTLKVSLRKNKGEN